MKVLMIFAISAVLGSAESLPTPNEPVVKTTIENSGNTWKKVTSWSTSSQTQTKLASSRKVECMGGKCVVKICENGVCRTEQREGNSDVDSLLNEKKPPTAQAPVLSVVPDPDSTPVQNTKKTQCVNGTCTTKICENGNCRFEQSAGPANSGFDPDFLNKP